jgi:hypothetical protein
MFGARKETKPAPPPPARSDFSIALAAAAAVAVVGVATALLKKKDTRPVIPKTAPTIPRLDLSSSGSRAEGKPALPAVMESVAEEVKVAVNDVKDAAETNLAAATDVAAAAPDSETVAAQVKAAGDAVLAEEPIQRNNSIKRIGSKLRKSFSTKNGN